MKYSIVGTGLVGKTLTGIFARQSMRALIANSRGPESLTEIAAELGPHIIPATVDRALDADIIFFAVGFLHFKEVAAKRPDWTGKIVIDVTNAALAMNMNRAKILTAPVTVIVAHNLAFPETMPETVFCARRDGATVFSARHPKTRCSGSIMTDSKVKR
jgi:predicted dinucleotide-binding enzyme